ncbi:Hypothetical protein NGAL_HAMBI2605_00040 [Neorhizobium galegae bv. orientalis]|nr:Hypothetical protein NGAL_HAMBI2566_07670 [Neorhizobium galegae bv. orientalis]CDZ58428.1 Hypothetical protein NGAL_HAMBI2605_00040 [Neorhizobium galegae bv. orientalis]CDZ70015.1 Hypothetical protein NGAL_HAMBI2610_16160 [Neorhizobium galegae bv. orientalis]
MRSLLAGALYYLVWWWTATFRDKHCNRYPSEYGEHLP